MVNYGNKRKNPWGFTAPNYVNKQMPAGKRRKYMLLSNTFYRATKYRSGLAKSKNYNLRRDSYKFKRSVSIGSIGANAGTGEAYWAGTFSLAQLPGYNDFTTLFDRYKITFVQLQFYLKYDPASGVADPGTNQANATHPCMYIIKDYDDANAPTSINELRQHAKCKQIILNGTKIIKYNIRPATLTETYRTGVTSTYSPNWKQWVDMANTDTPYYGVKFAVENMFGTNQTIQIRATYWFECKDTR